MRGRLLKGDKNHVFSQLFSMFVGFRFLFFTIWELGGREYAQKTSGGSGSISGYRGIYSDNFNSSTFFQILNLWPRRKIMFPENIYK